MSEEQTEDIKTIRVLTFSSEQQDWDEWSHKFLSMAAERGYRDIMEEKDSQGKIYSLMKRSLMGCIHSVNQKEMN